jgi:hypothetical protein
MWSQYDNLTVRNLSVSEMKCLGNMGKLAQATAANMPWMSDANATDSLPQNGRTLIYHDVTGAGNVDLLSSDQPAASWDWMQASGSSWSYFLPIYFTMKGFWQGVFRTFDVLAGGSGVGIVAAATNALRFYYADGVNSSYQGTAVNAITDGVWYLLEAHRTADDKIQMILNGSEILAPSSIVHTGGNADIPLLFGGRNTETMRAKRGRMYLYKGALSAGAKAQIRTWYNAHYDLGI